MQLDAVLQSFFVHCREADQLRIDILYKTSNDQHMQQYYTLINEYALRKNIKFHRQNNFHQDILNLMNPFLDLPSVIINHLYNFALHLNHRAMSLFIPFTAHLDDYVLFLVDDNLFVRDFSMLEVLNALASNSDTVGVSLRLGTNTTFCYALSKKQNLPQFIRISDSILKFDWTISDADFGYPLEISSSVYRMKDILPLIFSIPFENPNTLEGHLAQKAKRLRKRLPALLCFEQTVAFCNPINKVQNTNDNLFGIGISYSSNDLAQLFDEGYRIDINSYDNYLPNACHQEVELNLIKKDE